MTCNTADLYRLQGTEQSVHQPPGWGSTLSPATTERWAGRRLAGGRRDTQETKGAAPRSVGRLAVALQDDRRIERTLPGLIRIDQFPLVSAERASARLEEPTDGRGPPYMMTD